MKEKEVFIVSSFQTPSSKQLVGLFAKEEEKVFKGKLVEKDIKRNRATENGSENKIDVALKRLRKELVSFKAFLTYNVNR